MPEEEKPDDQKKEPNGEAPEEEPTWESAELEAGEGEPSESPGDSPEKKEDGAEAKEEETPPETVVEEDLDLPPMKPPGLLAEKPEMVDTYPPVGITRRGFLFTSAGIAWLTFGAASGLGAIMTGRFMFPNVLFEPSSKFKAGKPDDYAVGEVDTRWKEKYGVWIVRTEQGLYALSTTCTHLGCIPNWLKTEQKFKCPCHGSGFYKNGVNFEGPAPRPLERYRIALDPADGQILVDKSRAFRYELGQWDNPEALLRT